MGNVRQYVQQQSDSIGHSLINDQIPTDENRAIGHKASHEQPKKTPQHFDMKTGPVAQSGLQLHLIMRLSAQMERRSCSVRSCRKVGRRSQLTVCAK